MLHVVQVAIDAAMDLVAMLVKDMGGTVSDNYHNLQALQDAGRLDGGMAEGLRMLNGLRNAIVHRYNTFERKRVEEGLEEIRSLLLDFAETLP
jgi:uncharacterized protein YutE (UPF0331/DUF86 family)